MNYSRTAGNSGPLTAGNSGPFLQTRGIFATGFAAGLRSFWGWFCSARPYKVASVPQVRCDLVAVVRTCTCMPDTARTARSRALYLRCFAVHSCSTAFAVLGPVSGNTAVGSFTTIETIVYACSQCHVRASIQRTTLRIHRNT